MNKFDPTTLDKLTPGDRFYFADDAKKRVQQLVKHEGPKAYLGTVNVPGSGRWMRHKKGYFDLVKVVFLNSKKDRKK